ncbi:MAG: hypothetical protein A2Y40_08825 [Candidatus Margulisbacteria bacterium GWF2_35_9]|nr:MAG: hypothetical protein A2Y40_08825 [Candidatus Margulisbacteria bacterium GWF2_35_9]
MEKLLLHVCCAPCSTAVIEKLQKNYEITCLFYNPNIHPEEEYKLRLKEALRYSSINNVVMKEENYVPDDWHKVIKGTETATEKSGVRCAKCFALRLEKTAEIASKERYDYFTTTLSVSPHKNVNIINEIGYKLEKDFSSKYYSGDFKKEDGYKRSIELSKEYNLYRQSYCGCIYSREKKN